MTPEKNYRKISSNANEIKNTFIYNSVKARRRDNVFSDNAIKCF